MAHYKRIDTSPKFLPVDLSRQLPPGTFENEVSVKANVSNANVKRSGRVMHSHLISGSCKKKDLIPRACSDLLEATHYAAASRVDRTF